MYVALAAWQGYRRQWGAVIESARTALDLNPAATAAHSQIGFSLMSEGNLEGALDEFGLEPDPGFRLQGLAIIYHALGRAADSDAALHELTESYDSRAALIARVYAYRGEAGQAFYWLNRAAQSHDPLLQVYIHSPWFDNIRSDPRWLPFLESLGLSPAQLAKIEFNFKLPD